MNRKDIDSFYEEITSNRTSHGAINCSYFGGYFFCSHFLKKYREREELEKKLMWLSDELECAAIACKAKMQEGYSFRNSYNDGYKDGVAGKHERKGKHPTIIKDTTINRKED